MLYAVHRAVAQSAHGIPSRAPLRLEVGDHVKIGERDTDWPAFVFVSSPKGCGWVPERYLNRDGQTAVAIRSYDTQELSTRAGDVLEIVRVDSPSGWAWCRAPDGREGWVPQRTLRAD